MFTAPYSLCPCIKQKRLFFEGLVEHHGEIYPIQPFKRGGIANCDGLLKLFFLQYQMEGTNFCYHNELLFTCGSTRVFLQRSEVVRRECL